jgi:hypothetical protein
MSDTPTAFPPPPPASIPPPAYQPAPSPLPNYQPPPMAQPPAGYPQMWQQPQPGVNAGWASVGILTQFSGIALWAIFLGAVTVVVPLFFGRVFFFLPILGIISGARAIQQGKLIGGIVGIVLSAIGGILTLVGLFG